MTKIDLLYPAPQRKTYKPVERCIYCGAKASSESRLSREHIIAHGMSGTLILPEASCASCSEITGKIEGVYLQRMIRDARVHLKLASRRHRRNKAPPPTLSLDRTLNGITRRVELTPDQHPYWLVALGLGPPGVLIGADSSYAPLFENLMLPGDDWTRRWAGAGAGISVEYFVDTTIFVRMLAKIAHSFAVASLGIRGFKPVLPEIILNGDPKHPQYVGGHRREFDDRASRPNVFHSLQLTRESGWIIVNLRLFAFIEGTPNYRVVVGQAA